jgi:predicted peroxiredoxin
MRGAGASCAVVTDRLREKESAVSAKVLVNLATGMEDPERVTVAFLVATAALEQGKSVVIWATKDAVRLGLPGEAKGEACKGCPPLERLFEQFADGGGELWLCPICLNARGLADDEKVGNTKVAGATPMWEWAGEGTTVFSY